MDLATNQFIAITGAMAAEQPPPATFGNPSVVNVAVGMAGGPTPALFNDDGISGVEENLLRRAPAALTANGWGVAAFTSQYDPDTGVALLGFNLQWNCVNGGGPDIQQNVKDGLTEALQSIGFYSSQIDLDTTAIGQCGLVYSSTQPPNTNPVNNSNPNGSAISNPLPPIGTGLKSAQSWFDKNFFTGAGTLTGVGIGALALVAVVVLSKNK